LTPVFPAVGPPQTRKNETSILWVFPVDEPDDSAGKDPSNTQGAPVSGPSEAPAPPCYGRRLAHKNAAPSAIQIGAAHNVIWALLESPA
jgi:hypothetical protein